MFGVGLMSLAAERDDIIVLSADMSTPAGLDKFKASYPDRFINVGIAEQNMIGIAAGLADEGYVPVCVAQACFISMRAFEQVRQFAGYMNGRIILVGIGAGLSLQYMGNTHFAIEDMALMRTIPGMTVVSPCDAYEAIMTLTAAISSPGPVYIRLNAGLGSPVVYNEPYKFIIGKAHQLMDGDDVQIIATGSMVHVALQVADDLSARGVNANVVNMHTIKPIDDSIVNCRARLAVTIEEHSVIGGLGSAMAEVLINTCPQPRLLTIGVDDRFLQVGSYNYLLEQAGLTVEQIVRTIMKELTDNKPD